MADKVIDERVGFELVDVANQIGSSLARINARITDITDRFVTTATDIRKEAIDWFEIPLKLTGHLDRIIRSMNRVEKVVEILIAFLWVLTVVIIAKFVLEAVYETVDVCVFCNKRPRRMIPVGAANRTASLPIVWRTEKKRSIELQKLASGSSAIAVV